MANIDDNAWMARYRIVSRTGRVYSRKMLIDSIMRDGLTRLYMLTRAQVAAVVDDDAFLSRRAGEVPARIIEAVQDEAISRRSNA